jgi:hypothetical protein
MGRHAERDKQRGRTSARAEHHIVPWAITNHEVIQKAASAGSDKAFHPNEIFNGINLPESRHLGSHANYDTKIQQRLDEWMTDPAHDFDNISPDQAANSIRQWLQSLKAQIETTSAHINDIVPPIIPSP